MNVFLYLSTVLIWGSTWIAIYFQLGDVPIAVSVFYRFALAAVLLLPIVKLLGKLQPTKRIDHVFFVLQGACLFSLNFLCFYQATQYIASGLVSVIFSLATLFNAVNNRLLWKTPITGNFAFSAIIGISGLVLLFWGDISGNMAADLSAGLHSSNTLKGMAFAALGTYFFSLGNMISKRHSDKGIQPATTNSYSMIYGTVILGSILMLTNQPLVIDTGVRYLSALVYLSVVGSVLGFTAYLMLVGRIGPNKAAYTTVMFPIIALALSSVYEGYEWQLSSVIGLLLAIFGNFTLNLKFSIFGTLRQRLSVS